MRIHKHVISIYRYKHVIHIYIVCIIYSCMYKWGGGGGFLQNMFDSKWWWSCFFSDVPIHSHHFRMGICSLMQFGFCFFRVLASIGCGHWNTIVSFDTQNNSAATMFSRSNAQSKIVFRAPPPYPVELSFSFPSQTFGPEELLAKYLDEDQPMRSWLSSKHDEKVLFFFVTVFWGNHEWHWMAMVHITYKYIIYIYIHSYGL